MKKGAELPWMFIIILILFLILFVVLFIWHVTGFSIADSIFGNYTNEVPSNITGGPL